MRRLKATGQRGSWFAEVGGEQLPCVHQYWSRSGKYDDPYVSENTPPWPEFLHAISTGKKVILTKDIDQGDGKLPFKREGYIAVFEVENVKIEDGHLRFAFSKRLADLE